MRLKHSDDQNVNIPDHVNCLSLKVGDIIEKHLIQHKDVTKVMKMAKLGR